MTEAEEVAAIPLVEERLEVGKRQVASGRVKVRVSVDSREEIVPAELADDEVEIRRVPRNLAVGELPAAAGAREELVARRDVKERTERIAETPRRTEVDVERLRPEAAGDGESAGDSPVR
jgi:stress response protein YsnF